MNKSAQNMIKAYRDNELLDLFAELKVDLSNPKVTMAPREFTENAEMLEIVEREILERMKGGNRE